MKKLFVLFLMISSISFGQFWQLTDSLKITCPYAVSVQLVNGNILVTGGLSKNGSNFTNQTEIFDYKNEKWNLASPMNVGRGTHVMVRLNNGNVIAIGGFGTKTCEIFDTLSQSWSLTDSLHDLRSDGETVTLLDNGNVLITGGWDETNNVHLKSCEVYNINQAKWILTDSLNSVRAYHTATKLLNGKVLSAGGMTYNVWTPEDADLVLSNTKMCYIFDPNGANAVEQPKNLLPKDFRLYQNYPNPFNPSTTVRYELPKTSHVIIKIYNSIGEEVTTLIDKSQPAGSYSVNFNAKNLSSGIYFYQIVADGWVSTNKMLLIK
jgi:hypothetical protein